MAHDGKDCENCGYHFPTVYSRTVHQCPNGNPESDAKLRAFLIEAKEKKEVGDEKKN